MSETKELIHPLDGFALNIRGVKCFDEDGSGCFHFAPITFIIGKNNSGKSTVLDVLQECCGTQRRMFEGPLTRAGTTPYIEIRKRPDEAKLKREFAPSISGGSIPGQSHWHYAEQNILPYNFLWVFDHSRKASVQNEGEIVKTLVPDAVKKME